MTSVPEEVLRHYAQIDESARITRGIGQLERLRAQEIVRRYLPAGRLEIADVGGGPGAHAAWLAEDGHSVHLVDPVEHHVAAARTLPTGAGQISAQLGQAGELPFADQSMDAVLLFGPLYHLTDREDRVTALKEARRVVRPSAPIFVAAVNRFASLLDGLARKWIFDPTFRQIVEGDLRDGQHRNPDEHPGWFTTAYFHHPDEIGQEAADAGLTVEALLGVEGIGEWLPGLAEDLENSERREVITWAARMIESEPTLAGLSAHMILVGRRPA